MVTLREALQKHHAGSEPREASWIDWQIPLAEIVAVVTPIQYLCTDLDQQISIQIPEVLMCEWQPQQKQQWRQHSPSSRLGVRVE